MPNIQDLQLKNIEKELKPIGQFEGKEEKIEQGEPAQEKEARIEISPADKAKVLDEIAQAEKAAKAGATVHLSDVQQKYQQREKQIEKIMEHDLTDLYLKMPPDKQKEFKAVGEQTAKKINSLLDQAKVKVKEIIGLIRKWLQIIPGVNKFFLEQEAKIKADEIMRLKNPKS